MGIQQIGTTVTFSSTGFYYITDGSNTAFDWYVSECTIIDVDTPPEVQNSSGLTIGYDTTYNSITTGFGGLGVSGSAIIAGSLGIKTSTPAYDLDVNGYVGATRFYPAYTNGAYIYGDGGGLTIGGTGYFYQSSTNGSYFQNTVRFRGIIQNDSDTYLRIDGGTSNHTYFNSSVGIGVSSPVENLDVYEANNGSWAPRILARDGVVASFLGAYNSRPGVFAHNNALNAWADLYVNTADGTVSGAGNVIMGANLGIGTGTTAPVSPLHLGNNVSAGGFTSFSNYQILLYKSGTVATSYGIGIESSTMMFNSDDTYKFYVDNVAKVSINSSGTITAAGDLIAYGSPSDISLKTIKGKVTNALDSIVKLNGYKFDWKEPNEIANIKEDIGVIAQEVEELFPELVRTNENTGTKSVRYQGLIAILIEAVKEQQKQIDELKYLLKNK